MTMRELCEERRRRAARRPRDQGAADRRPARRASCPRSKLDTPFDFDAARRRGLHGRPRRHRRLRRADRHARRRPPPAALRRARELRQVLPVPDRAAARARDVRGRRRRSTAALLEELLETLEVGSLCAHGGGMPAPIRSLLAALPRRAGAGVMPSVTVDGAAVEVEPGATVLEAARAAGRWVPTLCFDERQAPFGACRVCLVGVEGAPRPSPSCTTPCRDGMEVDTEDPTARRVAGDVVELVLSELPEPPARAHRARRRSPRGSASASRAGAAPTHEPRARRPPSLPRRSGTSSASRAAAACAPATRSRAPSR